jgi:hypothetical protein
MDVAGDNQLNLEHEMLKQRISANGELLGEPGVEIIGEVVLVECMQDFNIPLNCSI